MLVISRKQQQRVTVGNIVITVVKIGDKRVRLGIEAPERVPIIRDDAKRKG